MTTDTVVDWEAIRQEVEKVFGIPDDLESNGIKAIRAMVYRSRNTVATMLFEIKHGEVGLIGDMLDSYVEHCFENMPPEYKEEIGMEGRPGQGLGGKEILGDVVIIEFTIVEGMQEKAEKLVRAMFILLGNYANRNSELTRTRR